MIEDENQATAAKRSERDQSEITRRGFLRAGAVAFGAATVACSTANAQTSSDLRTHGSSDKQPRQSSYFDLLRVPDELTAFKRFDKTLPAGIVPLKRQHERWAGVDIRVETKLENDGLVLTLASPSTAVAAVHVRWHRPVSSQFLILGDAWERSYGELGWRNIIPERVMPWYFATYDHNECHGYGVKTDARALCFWQVDSQGVSLWLNVTNGGDGVLLGDRQLTMATVTSQRGSRGIGAFDSVAALCRKLCARTSRKLTPIYGANDWCYSYGTSTAEKILRDTEYLISLSPSGEVRPFSVIDGGWENGTAAWPDMMKLAAEIKQRRARPGLWIRPLEAPHATSRPLLLSDARFGERADRARELAYDPTISEARELIRAKLRQAVGWGYEMVKHDFSTYDLLGQWGFEMGPQPTLPGWSLHDRSQTNAEVIASLYSLIREAAGEAVLIDGCNAIGHLGQGIFELQRVGDDTSGHQWERTRRMGVNTAAFRLPQNGIFFTVDPDLVGITEAVPWEFNRQWLDLLARSGAATIISADPSAQGPEQQAAIKEAFQIAAAGGLGAKPIDWMETSTPERWHAVMPSAEGPERTYKWSGIAGASPFLSP